MGEPECVYDDNKSNNNNVVIAVPVAIVGATIIIVAVIYLSRKAKLWQRIISGRRIIKRIDNEMTERINIENNRTDNALRL